MKPSEAKKRYMKVFVPSMVLYLISILAVTRFLKSTDLALALKYGLAIIPALFVWWLIWAQARYFKEADEFERSRQIQGMLYGVGAILVLSTGWGLLELLADAPRFEVFYVFPLFCLAYSIGRFMTKSQDESCS